MAKRTNASQYSGPMLAYLGERGIDSKDAQRSGLYEVDSARARALDFTPALSGFVIPYCNPFDRTPLDVRRIRPFDPPVIDNKPRKFIQAKGTPVEAYFDPSVDWVTVLNDTRQPLHIVEGEIKAIAANKHGVTTIGLGGVNSYGGDSLTPLLQQIDWKGRRIYVVYDSDASTNPNVQRAEAKLATILTCKGALVTIVRLPNIIPGGKTGFDDFLLRAGKEAFIGLRDATPTVSRAPQSETIVWKPLGELMAQPIVAVDYVLEGILAKGTMNIIVSKPKVGKSTLARNLVLAVSRGKPFIGRKTQKGSSLYLSLEERAEDVVADFRAMGADGTEDIHIADAGIIPTLVATIRERRPDVVAIDPMIRLARVQDTNSYAELYGVLGPLIDVARETGACIVILHHSSKIAKGDAIDAPLGSTAMAGAVSTLIVMKRLATHRTIQTVQRIGQDMPETVFQFDENTKRLSLGGRREDTEVDETGDRIIAFVGEESFTEPEILRGLEGGNNRKVHAIRRLTAKGKLIRSGTGKRGDSYRYSLTPTVVQNGEEDCAVRGSDETSQRPMPIGRKGRIRTTPSLVSTRVRQNIQTSSTTSSRSEKVVRRVHTEAHERRRRIYRLRHATSKPHGSWHPSCNS